MKGLPRLLIASVVPGLMVSPGAPAAELNLGGVSHYVTPAATSFSGQAGFSEQASNVQQFSDLQPSDWAYQALAALIERYGCVAGYPDGTYRGQRAMTRYEAAALLNACLDRITEITDELKKLMKEFEKELAVIRGRVDGLEARVGELEATQFSTTTRLRGVATFVLGANGFAGTATPDVFDALTLFGIGGQPFTDNTLVYAHTARALEGATAFAYDLSLYLDTSFTGQDLLRTRLRAGNFRDSPWFGVPRPVGLNALEVGFEELCGTETADCGDVLAINRLFYQFPLGHGFTATVGGRVRQDDMLALWPSAYPATTILDFFTYAGAPGAYAKSLGAGGGLWWKSGGFSVSANYVALNGDSGSPGVLTTDQNGGSRITCGGGIGTACTQSTFTGQVAYGADRFGLAAAFSHSQGGEGLYGGNGTPLAVAASSFANSSNSLALSAYWAPVAGRLFPSISAGWGMSGYTIASTNLLTSWIDGARSQSWSVGLQWNDVLAKGNSLGMAVGQPTFITRLQQGLPILSFGGGGEPARRQTPNDGNYAWEWWYKLQLRDNISVTPALYYLSAPVGGLRSNGADSLSNFGGLVKTTFRF